MLEPKGQYSSHPREQMLHSKTSQRRSVAGANDGSPQYERLFQPDIPEAVRNPARMQFIPPEQLRNFDQGDLRIYQNVSQFHDLPLSGQLKTIEQLFLSLIEPSKRTAALQHAAKGAQALEALAKANIDSIAQQQSQAQLERDLQKAKELEKQLENMVKTGKIPTQPQPAGQDDIKIRAKEKAHNDAMEHLLGAWPIDTQDPAISIPLQTLSESMERLADLISWPAQVSGLPSNSLNLDNKILRDAEDTKGQPLSDEELRELEKQNPGKILTPEQWAKVKGLGPKALMFRLLQLQMQENPFRSFHIPTNTTEISGEDLASLQVFGSALNESRDYDLLSSLHSINRGLDTGKAMNFQKLMERSSALRFIPVRYIQDLAGVSGFLDQTRKSLGSETPEDLVYSPSEKYSESDEYKAIEAWNRKIHETLQEVDTVSYRDMDPLKEKLVTMWLREVPGRRAGELLADEPRLLQMLSQEKTATFPFVQIMDDLGRIMDQKSSYPTEIQNMVDLIFFHHTTTPEDFKREADPAYRNIRDNIIEAHSRMINAVLSGSDPQELEAVRGLAKRIGTEHFVKKMTNLIVERMLFPPLSGAPEYQLNPYMNDAIHLLEHQTYAEAQYTSSAEAAYTLIYGGTRFYVLEELWERMGELLEFPEEVQRFANDRREFLDKVQTQKEQKGKGPPTESIEKRRKRPFDRLLIPKSEHLEAIRQYMGSDALINIDLNRQEYEGDITNSWNEITGTMTYAPHADPGFHLVHHMDLQRLPGVREDNEFAKAAIFGADYLIYETELPASQDQPERKSVAGYVVLGLGDPEHPIKISGVVKNGEVDVFLPFEEVDTESVRFSEHEGMRITYENLMMDLIHDTLLRAEYRGEKEKAEEAVKEALSASSGYTRPSPVGLIRYKMLPLGLESEDTEKGAQAQQESRHHSYPTMYINTFQRPLRGATAFRRACDEWTRVSRKISDYRAGSEPMEMLQERLRKVEQEVLETWEEMDMPTIENLKDLPADMKLARRRIPNELREQLIILLSQRYPGENIEQKVHDADAMPIIKGRRGGESRIKTFYPYTATRVHGFKKGGDQEADSLLGQQEQARKEAIFSQDEESPRKRYKVSPIGNSSLLQLNAKLKYARARVTKDNQLTEETDHQD